MGENMYYQFLPYVLANEFISVNPSAKIVSIETNTSRPICIHVFIPIQIS
jgi:hypothetical protein